MYSPPPVFQRCETAMSQKHEQPVSVAPNPVGLTGVRKKCFLAWHLQNRNHLHPQGAMFPSVLSWKNKAVVPVNCSSRTFIECSCNVMLQVWPKLASFFELPPGEPQKFSMVTVMADYVSPPTQAFWSFFVNPVAATPLGRL